MTDKFSLLAGIAADWWWEMDAELRFTFLSERFVEIFGLPKIAILLGSYFNRDTWIADKKGTYLCGQPARREIPAAKSTATNYFAPDRAQGP